MIEFPKPTVEQYFTSYTISNFSVSPDGKKLFFSTNLNGKMNIWAMDVNKRYPYLFSQKNESTNFVKYDPDGRFVLAGFDQDGDENYQIYAIGPDGGIPQPLITGEPEEKYYFGRLSENGDKIYYTTSKGNESFLNSKVYNLETSEHTLLFEGDDAATFIEDVSPDERKIAYMKLYANTYILGMIQTEDGEVFVTPEKDTVHTVGDINFVSDDEVWFQTNYESEYSYLAKYNLTKKEFSKVMDFGDESITSIIFNKDRNKLYLITENGVVDHFYYYDLNTQRSDRIDVPFESIGQCTTTKNGDVFVLAGSAVSPFNIWKYDGGSWDRLTENRVLGVTEKDMSDPEIIKYASYDGLEIEALLFRAKEENSNGYTIFWPHGGPQAAERKFYRAMFQMFLNRGYNIFCPNFRGSTGYGASFVKMVEQDWGEGPRLDNVEGVKWLFDNDISSPEKLFLVGGSYGGYMALLLHGRHPEYFRAVVDIFGVSDLFTFYNSVPEHWKPIMERWVGDPERDIEKFTVDSPVTYLDTMTNPMLVIQGAKDPRVVKEESDQIVKKLENAGREVEYLVLEDEGHGFSKKENEIKVYKTMLGFLEKHH
ncbi:alpha/beta hydrolase family protein [Salinicoccus halodurans]|uniref:Dipeptidyl aminopeptidase/acylaminoacyl peptidase n=1 Tax=Salinicoccus halodurans TaxID=407035 RepID=A0A0F7HLM9_9STAP|nr:S9 family peptidase [Salinicoccus halodurans]AKG74877.1 peptidase S9 [Salinicoccus halodurans]SFK69042.1 Dipeptidyl aminopeptidase/acylaminoacyl peptidase [Salinicoccus halodurans]